MMNTASIPKSSSQILEPVQQECPTKSVAVIARSLVVSVLGMDNESSSRGCGGEEDSEFVILGMSYFEVVICILMSSPT